ncbi:MAG: hypothetical protein QM484_00800 [Woeseiaceae bacterium]
MNLYVPAITAVLNWVGKPIVHGLKTWDEWEGFDENHLFDYVADEARNEAINSLRELLIQSKKCARVIGLSGLGKTRLALEICRGNNEYNNFSKRVVYIDAAYHEPNLPGLISSWVRHGLDCLLVVDNCELSLHKQIRHEVEHPTSTISLLTLHYNPEKDSDTNPIQIRKMSDELIKSMLEPVYGEKINDLDRIVEFAQGFPQMAVLLAKARLDQTKDMGSLTDDDLVKKMLWGGYEQDENAKKILEACSLFDKFGLEKEVDVEAKFIAEVIAGTNEDTLYRCVKLFEERGVINRGGRFAQIIPKPLAIRLAADWWRTTRPKRQQDLIETEMPGQLERSFCDQVAKLDFLPQVKELTENLCGNQGPFGQTEVILSNRGSRLFRSLVEVNPKATSEALFKILLILSHEQLTTDITDEVRRNLVWALEKLCFHKDVFEKSAKCLMWLASAENEDWANNATGQFVQLFRTFLSGTEATPVDRLEIIDYAIKHEANPIRELAVQALDSAIDTYGGSRTVGAEYQGSGEPLVEWKPKIWQEAFDYWIAAIERLTSLALENSEVSQSAKEVIAAHIRGLSQRGLDVMLALDNAIKKIVDAQGPLWPKAIDSIKTTISFDTDNMPDELRQKLNEWIDLLTPSRLVDRISLIVSNPSYEHEEDKDGNYIDRSAINVEDFASGFSDDISILLPNLPQLLSGEQRQGYWFGRNVVLSSKQWEPLVTDSIHIIESEEFPNINFLLGLLDGIYELNPETWNSYVNQFIENKKIAKFFPEVIRTGFITNEHLEQIIFLITSGLLDIEKASLFTCGRALDEIKPDIVSNFVNQLKNISNTGAWIALDILSMYCHGSEEKRSACKQTFKNLLVDLPLDRENKRKALEVHHWKTAVEKIIDDNDSEFAKKLIERILISCNDKMDYGDIHHYIKPVIRLLFKNYGGEVWPIIAAAIKTADNLQKYRLSQLLSSEDGFNKVTTSVMEDLDEDILKEWCVSEPNIAPEFVAKATDVYVRADEGYKLSSRAKFLIDTFGNNEKVLRTLSVNMGSFGWTGSVVPYYEKEIIALESLSEHGLENVREWADRRIMSLKKQIEQEKERDEEMEWGIH